MSSNKFNLLALSKPEIKTLHLTWFAFFLSFMVWFAHAPLMMVIRDAMHLSDQEVKILLILNISLTIPARIVVGMLVDKYGPKQLFSSILILGGLISIGFSFSQTYQQLAIVRFLSGFVGAGFVVGIRMISEWFPARQIGILKVYMVAGVTLVRQVQRLFYLQSLFILVQKMAGVMRLVLQVSLLWFTV